MTREELIAKLEEHKKRAHMMPCVGVTYGILTEAIDHLRAPQPLKRWTKKDGTPPDGYYLSALNLSGELIEIDGDCFYWAEDAGEELGQAYTRRLWEAFSVLYRLPIEPASGEKG